MRRSSTHADGGPGPTPPEQLSLCAKRSRVERIEGDTAFLTDGPAAGTEVVTVGAAELVGPESGHALTAQGTRVPTDASRPVHHEVHVQGTCGTCSARRATPMMRWIVGLESEVPLPHGRSGGGHDGLRRRAAARHAGRRLPRIRAAEGRGSHHLLSASPRPMWRPWSPSLWSRRSTGCRGWM